LTSSGVPRAPASRGEQKKSASPTRLQKANSGCMLSGARRVHPVIVGWSTANRLLCPSPSMMIPLPHGPGATPGRNWVVLDVAARHRMVVRTESLRIQNRHDAGSTSPRSVGEVALIWDSFRPVGALPPLKRRERADVWRKVTGPRQEYCQVSRAQVHGTARIAAT
jgi:hypothetical protein